MEPLEPETHETQTQEVRKLRTVTIWTTWLSLFVTILAPILYLLPYDFRGEDFSIGAVYYFCYGFAFIWLFSGSPMIVSSIFSLLLKHPASLVILLGSTVVYGLWFGYSYYLALSGSGGCMSGFWIIYIAPSSLIFMIPVWILALIFNAFNGKKANANPGSVLRSVPRSLEGENNEEAQ